MKAQNIHQLTLPTPFAVGDVHAYLHVGDRVTLFDAGVYTEKAWESLKDQLKELSLKPEDVDEIVLTHHHPDHIGLVGKFTNVKRVYGHPYVNNWLTKDERYFKMYIDFFNQLYDDWGVPEAYREIEKSTANYSNFVFKSALTDELLEGQKIEGLPSIEVLETPGHAQSHLSFFDHESGILIGGDHIIKHISSNPLLEPPSDKGIERPRPLLDYRQSMLKLKDYDITEILPGHGEVLREYRALIDDRILKQEKRAYKVLDFIKNNSATPFEICKFLFPKHYEKQFGLTMSETVGQLDYLQSVGEIVEVRKDNVITFESTSCYA
ncbi:MBL fold metallo-hydrolase [Halalkalibacillus sediminis]|uniref:MBL fold metallo-hydrolase n=1 Tax=Halalkalibacillus sediminis TaxID=2018042 RepID=A0A2I0QX46_9BACI|nr:MBL fold metallo-hydrolase [Halalkalibacillus sediminis]PKR78916.1 MBL fold metallo-hydrolase [Halalkalibacillus sediminis]